MDVRDTLDLAPARPTSSRPPWADLSLAMEVARIDAKKCTDDAQPDVQPTCIQTTHCDLPAGYTLNAGKVDEQAVVTISIGQA